MSFGSSPLRKNFICVIFLFFLQIFNHYCVKFSLTLCASSPWQQWYVQAKVVFVIFMGWFEA
jgi:hypothetical protein